MLSVSFCLVSCSKETLNEKELYTYLKDEGNGLIHKWEKEPFGISVMYKPSSLLAKRELEKETDLQKIKEITDRYNQYLYFVLNYSYKDEGLLNAYANKRSIYAELVNVMSFGMKEKVGVITDNKQKLPLVDFIHNRHYGMGGGSTILLVFNRDDVLNSTKDRFKITLKDIGVGIGNISFDIEKEKIEYCPTLK